MPVVYSNGGNIFWNSSGSGPAVLLTHGYGVTSEMWDGQVEALSDKYQIVTWDMRGHGQSDSPDDQAQYSEEKCLEDMVRVLDEAGVDKVILGGLSLGGYLSLAFRHAYPERVAALLLCDTGPGFKSEEGRAKWNQRADETVKGLQERGLAALADRKDSVTPTHRTHVGLIRSADGVFRQRDSHVIDGLPDIKVPTLVVVGENDEPLLAGCHYMARKIAGARLIVVPNSGHYPNVDEPELFNSAVREFLNGVVAAA